MFKDVMLTLNSEEGGTYVVNNAKKKKGNSVAIMPMNTKMIRRS